MLERLLRVLGKSVPVKSILLATALNYSPALISSSYAQQTVLPAGWIPPTYDPATGYFCATADQGRKCYAEANEAISYFQLRARQVQASPSSPAVLERRESSPTVEPPVPEYLQRWKQEKEWSAQLWREQEQKKAEEQTSNSTPSNNHSSKSVEFADYAGLIAGIATTVLGIALWQSASELNEEQNRAGVKGGGLDVTGIGVLLTLGGLTVTGYGVYRLSQ